jgi:uncharacterized protein
MNFLYDPWPWYVAGPIIGLTVPALLFLDNKALGISSTLRQICAACYPADIPMLKYNWRNQFWNLFFVTGVLIGGFIGGFVFANTEPVDLNPATINYLASLGITNDGGLMPTVLFNWNTLFTLKGFFLMIVGGFLVGFGTRWAGGCTSGHGILGLSALQWPSLLATASFFVGGMLFSYFVLPYILTL